MEIRGYQKNFHYSKELERAVLGICLLEKPPIKGVLSVLSPEMFYDLGHQAVYSTIKEMSCKNIPVDLLTVADYIFNVKKVNKIAGYEVGYFLTRLTNDVVSSAHVNYHSAIIKDMYQRRCTLAAEIEGRLISAPKQNKPRTFPLKIARYFLSIIDKQLIKEKSKLYGLDLIKGKTDYCIKVDSRQAVFMMSLIAPEYTWSTIRGDEHYDRNKIKTTIPKNSILKARQDGSRYWENHDGFPNDW